MGGGYLNIVDKSNYQYIMTYSFPCTDLSLAGKRAGMKKGSGTRSGLLWEVERLLNETQELPDILIMENVPQVLRAEGWYDWCFFLESKGYSNYAEVLNAKNFGIPQNRERCFMVSILGDYNYEFPKEFKLDVKLKDFLEDNVDEKYYISEAMVKYIFSKNDKYKVNDKKLKINRDIACCVTAREVSSRADTSNYIGIVDSYNKYMPKNQEICGAIPSGYSRNQGSMIVEKLKDTKNYIEWKERGKLDIDCRAWKEDSIAPTTTTIPKTKVLLNDLRIRKLTPRECFRLMGVLDEDSNKLTCSDTQKYKQAGNSIVTTCLMAIYSQLYDNCDYKYYIKKLVNELRE